ncbi:MAG: bifunctional 3-deoxy-7-phosphoheptulonate synthase/chorismate mutase type II [Bacteroidales bacterium]|nr:bifunctional 3-deoxy-7-phosphoheptulonate synthase/chorismate mutase type II [Bacteroidales bacterium]
MKTLKSGLINKVLIAGPCSAESYNQLDEIAKGIVQLSPDYFRAGVWKPRTRPSEFEGIGIEALEWLRQIKKKYSLKVCTEVANPNHVEQCLTFGIDALWIGARTTTNPFSVQDIAEALKGEQLPIFVKNPLNPDLKLWIGAIERLKKAGIENVYAVHRGFSLTDNGTYRQTPLWQIPIELKRIFPDLKIICDPSHIAGKSELVESLSQTAMNIGLDGLMIEVHHNPQIAKTDAKQQLSIHQFKNLLNNLIISKTEENVLPEKINILRKEIDNIDNKLIELLSERMNVANKIAQIKKESNLSVLQVNRWNKLLSERIEYSQTKQLSESFIKEIFEQIHKESVRVQDEIIKSK